MILSDQNFIFPGKLPLEPQKVSRFQIEKHQGPIGAEGLECLEIFKEQAAVGGQLFPEVQFIAESQQVKNLTAVKAQALGIEVEAHQRGPGLPTLSQGQPHLFRSEEHTSELQ